MRPHFVFRFSKLKLEDGMTPHFVSRFSKAWRDEFFEKKNS